MKLDRSLLAAMRGVSAATPQRVLNVAKIAT